MLVIFWHAPVALRLQSMHSAFRAVDFFFCLSGFVIAFSYERRLQESFRFEQFVAARMIRLYPIYFAGILAGLLSFILTTPAGLRAPWLAHTLIVILLQFLVLPDVLTKGLHPLFPFNFPAWSIFFELLANFAYAFLLRRKFAGKWHLCVLFLGSLLGMGLWVRAGHGFDAGVAFNLAAGMGVIRVAVSFLAGVLVFRMFAACRPTPWTGTSGVTAALAVTAGLLLCLFAPSKFMQTQGFSAVAAALLFPALVYFGARCRVPTQCVATCAALGDLSYPLYLIHAPLLALFTLSWVSQTVARHPASRLYFVPSLILIASGLSLLMLRYYDKPVRSFLTARYNAMAA